MTDDRQSVAARNRALMPEFGQIAAEWKAIIPGTKVPHVCEGGITLGCEPVYTGTWVSCEHIRLEGDF